MCNISEISIFEQNEEMKKDAMYWRVQKQSIYNHKITRYLHWEVLTQKINNLTHLNEYVGVINYQQFDI
jgi:hypothetical protein